MSLYFRFLWLSLRLYLFPIKTRPSAEETNKLNLRVLPSDLDLLGHMNNAQYLAMCDLGRINMLVRAKVWQKMARRGWSAVVASETIQFRKELRPFQKFTLETRNYGWDEKFLYVEQKFVSEEGVHAIALVKVMPTGVHKPKPRDIIALWGVDSVEPEYTNDRIQAWNASNDGQWQDAVAV